VTHKLATFAARTGWGRRFDAPPRSTIISGTANTTAKSLDVSNGALRSEAGLRALGLARSAGTALGAVAAAIAPTFRLLMGSRIQGVGAGPVPKLATALIIAGDSGSLSDSHRRSHSMGPQ
jgi:hypothetical protein